MHNNKFRKLTIVLGITAIVILGGCMSEGKGYHQLAEIIKSLERNSELNIQGFVEFPNDFNQDIEKIELIQDRPIPTKSFIQDSILMEMQHFFQLAYNFKKAKAADLLTQIETKNQISRQNPYLYFYAKSLICKGINIDDLRFIQNADFELMSVADQYLLASSMLELGSNSLIGIPFELRITLLHYALYLIENNQHSELFSNLKGKLFYKKARQLIGESSEYIPISLELLNDANQIFARNTHSEMKNLTQWYEDRFSKDTIPNKTIYNFINTPIAPRDKVGPLLELGLINQSKNPEEAMNYFNLANETLSSESCTFIYQVITSCLAEVALVQLDTAKALALLQKVENISGCHEKDALLNKFKNFQWAQPLLNQILAKNLEISNFQTLLKEKTIARKYLHNEPQHWDDYLSFFGTRVLSNFIDTEVKDQKMIADILQIAQQSKERKIQTTRIEDENVEKKKKQLERTLLLEKIDDFKSRTDYGNEAYKLFFDYQVKNFGSNDYQAIALKELDFENTLPKFEKSKIELLGFNTFKGQNFGYSYRPGKLKIFEVGTKIFGVDTLLLNKLTNSYLERIRNQQDFSKEVDSLQTYFNAYFTPQSDHTLLLSTDGVFTFLPWHLIYPSQRNILRVHDLNAYFQEDSINVNKDSFNLFSYDDKRTLLSSRKFPKLVKAEAECKNIARILNLSENQIFVGEQFTLENLKRSFANNFVHIVSHSSSDRDNRLDNYLAIRDDQGKGKELYSYEIEQFEQAPKVVFLAACETEIGMQRNGTGTYSLSNAFAKIGTKTILKTLWRINDKASADFMNILYREWNTRISLQEALARTREYCREEKWPLMDWAGFVLEGQGKVYLQ